MARAGDIRGSSSAMRALKRITPPIALAIVILTACSSSDTGPRAGPEVDVDSGTCCPKPSLSDAATTTAEAGPCSSGSCVDASASDASCTDCVDASDAAVVDAAPDAPAAPPPALGAHALAYYRLEVRPSPLSTAAIATTAGGSSTIIASVGRGAMSAFATMRPFDNKNAGFYPQLGTTHAYTNWPTSGTALYGLTGAAGGANHVVSTATPEGDELTLAAVEVKNGSVVQDFKWNEVFVGNPVTSLPVTTTGPATLIAFWWGDATADNDKTATPNNGFTVIDSILEEGALVQCAVAVKSVAAAGSYDVTWTATPAQGAQLWLVAVQ